MSRPQEQIVPEAEVCSTYLATIDRYFPDFWKKIDALPEFRVAGRTKYASRMHVVTTLFRCFTLQKSHRKMDSVFNFPGGHVLDNLLQCLEKPVDTIPRGQTINYWLKTLKSENLSEILDEMCMTLLDNKQLEDFREPLEKTVVLGSDGTGLFATIVPIGHSTMRHHKDGRITYHVYVLLIAFLSPKGYVIPFHVEFIENGEDYNPEFDKQDCEHKAQAKVFSEVYTKHPHLPVTVLMDALSLDYTQMKLCIDNKWYFVISYKAGAVDGLNEELQAKLKSGEGVQHYSETREKGGKKQYIQYEWCPLVYNFGKAKEPGNTGFPITYVKITVTSTDEDGTTTVNTYERITNHKITMGNVSAFFDYMGETRWCEENQGFNEMKNLGLNIEHPYGCQGEAAKNHFLLQMIAFVIMQIAGKTDIHSKILALKHGDIEQTAEQEEISVEQTVCTTAIDADVGQEAKREEASCDNQKATPNTQNDNTQAGTKQEKQKAKTLRQLFSSLEVIALYFLNEIQNKIVKIYDVQRLRAMRIRWAYG